MVVRTNNLPDTILYLLLACHFILNTNIIQVLLKKWLMNFLLNPFNCSLRIFLNKELPKNHIAKAHIFHVLLNCVFIKDDVIPK